MKLASPCKNYAYDGWHEPCTHCKNHATPIKNEGLRSPRCYVMYKVVLHPHADLKNPFYHVIILKKLHHYNPQ